MARTYPRNGCYRRGRGRRPQYNLSVRHDVPSPAVTRLREFISTAMQMSHVYQPVMPRTLIDKGGKASVSQVAKALLAEDRAQVDYYREITKRMRGGPAQARDSRL